MNKSGYELAEGMPKMTQPDGVKNVGVSRPVYIVVVCFIVCSASVYTGDISIGLFKLWPIWVRYVDDLIILLAAGWTAAYLWKKKTVPHLGGISALLLAFVLWALISFPYGSISTKFLFAALYRILVYPLAFLCLANLAFSRAQLENILYVFFGVFVAQAPIMWGQWLRSPRWPNLFVGDFAFGLLGMGNANVAGWFIILGIIYLWTKVLSGTKNWFVIPIVFLAITQQMSCSCLCSLAFIPIFIVQFWRKARSLKMAIFMILTMLTVVSWYTLIWGTLGQELATQDTTKVKETIGVFEMLGTIPDLMKENQVGLLTGAGAGSFGSFTAERLHAPLWDTFKERNLARYMVIYPRSQIVSGIMEFGVVGFVLFNLVFVLLYVKARRISSVLPVGPEHDGAILLQVIVMFTVVAQLTIQTWELNIWLLPMWTIGGVLLGCWRGSSMGCDLGRLSVVRK
jgi:hypothetical protein